MSIFSKAKKNKAMKTLAKEHRESHEKVMEAGRESLSKVRGEWEKSKEGMAKSESDDAKYFDMFREKRIRASKNIFAVTIIMIAFFVGLGIFIDNSFGTKPVGIFVSLLISFPITQIAIIRRLRETL